MWTRLLWRESLSPSTAHTLRGAPDAFDTLMQTFQLRLKLGKIAGPLSTALVTGTGAGGALEG